MMFGLQSPAKKDKKGQVEEFVFELEKELRDPIYLRQLKERLDKRLLLVKSKIRGGSDMTLYPKYQVLVQGYACLMRLIARASIPQKK